MNKVLLVGRIVRDPFVQTTASGIKYARFTIAVNRPFSATNQADFIPIVAWRNNAEFVDKFLDKGALISVDGSFNSSTYQNDSNETVTRYEVSADRVQALETKIQAESRKNTSSASGAENTNVELSNMKFYDEDKTYKPKKSSNDDVPWDIE